METKADAGGCIRFAAPRPIRRAGRQAPRIRRSTSINDSAGESGYARDRGGDGAGSGVSGRGRARRGGTNSDDRKTLHTMSRMGVGAVPARCADRLQPCGLRTWATVRPTPTSPRRLLLLPARGRLLPRPFRAVLLSRQPQMAAGTIAAAPHTPPPSRESADEDPRREALPPPRSAPAPASSLARASIHRQVGPERASPQRRSPSRLSRRAARRAEAATVPRVTPIAANGEPLVDAMIDARRAGGRDETART